MTTQKIIGLNFTHSIKVGFTLIAALSVALLLFHEPYEKMDTKNWREEISSKIKESSFEDIDEYVSYSPQVSEKRILISVNMGGPNNQIWGLREGLYLSQLLDRSFVAPLFFRHFTTGGHFFTDPSVFIDLENLSRQESSIILSLKEL